MYHLNHKTNGVYSFSITRCIFLHASLIVAALLGGCSSAQKSYGIRGDGDPVLNRDVNGKSLSVVVRIYQLRDIREFSRLTFDTLADGRPETELLGQALLDQTDAVIVPGGTYTSTEKLHDETRFVGIVGLFRRPDTYYWRQLVEADTIRSQGLNFRVQDCYIAVNGAKLVSLPGQPANARPECGMANPPVARPATRPAAPAMQQAQQPQPYPVAPRQQPQPYSQAPQPYPQQGVAPNPGPQRSWLPQGMPEVNVNANTPLAPANVRFGSGGVSSVTIGEQAPAAAQGYPPPQTQPYYGQPYQGQPYYGQPAPPQPYPAQNPYAAPRY